MVLKKKAFYLVGYIDKDTTKAMNLNKESKLKKMTLNLYVLRPDRIIWDS